MAPDPAPAVQQQAAEEPPPEVKPLKALVLLSQKRTREMFVGNHGQRIPPDEERYLSAKYDVHENESHACYGRQRQ